MSLAWDTARDLAYRAVGPLPAVDRPLTRSLGYRLAGPLTAGVPLPPFATAAMDGWAVAGPSPWTVQGRIAAGEGTPRPLAPGAAVEIATGAMVPAGADAVVALEAAHPGTGPAGSPAGAATRLHAPTPPAGQHIRPAGEEAAAGEQLVPGGVLVSPVVLGVAAAAGYDSLPVRPRPRARLLVTGDELLAAGAPTGGRIRDSLGPLLPGLLNALGADLSGRAGAPAGPARVPDQPGALEQELRAAVADGVDLVVTTGSTSVGRADHLHPVLAGLGAEILVDGVACRPGHPQLLAVLPGGVPLLGLPGNPLAAVVAALTLLGPLLARLGGAPLPALCSRPLATPLDPHPHLTRLIPVRCGGGGDGDAEPAGTLTPVASQGPAMLRGLLTAHGFAVLSPAAELLTHARLLPLPWDPA